MTWGNSMSAVKTILSRMKKDRVRFINLQFSDIMGIAKGITIPVEQAKNALGEGLWFDGSSIEGFTRIFESDMILRGDLKTYRIIPWLSDNNHHTARIICDVYTPDGKPYEDDPRYILRKVMKEAKDMGFTYNTGPELEFFLFKTVEGSIRTADNAPIIPHDRGKYFDLVMDKAFNVRRDMIFALEKLGIEVEASHHEVASGQHEIDFRYDNALTTADNALTFKYTLKAIAQKHDLHATFMPKPITGINGNGMHVHQSLFKGDKNAFFNKDDKYNLSKTAYHFLAGQMHHAQGMAAILNPLVNSYKRLVPGYEAATYICWARQNRSALIRIPSYVPGKESSTRMEIRCPDPCANPYLAFAVLLKAGLDGIKKKMTPTDPVEEDVFKFSDEKLYSKKINLLPHSLWQAIKSLKENKVIQSVLGPGLCEKYIQAKTDEWDRFRVHVTDWEVQEYLENV